MNPPRPVALVAASLALASAAVAFAAWRTASATRELSVARVRVQRVARDCGEVLALRQQRASVAEAKRPDTDLYAAVRACLTSAGLRPDLVRGLAQESDTPVRPPSGQAGAAEAVRRRQSVRFNLEPVAPEGLGRFLAAWRSEQPLWGCSRLDLQAIRPRTPSEAGGLYRVTLVVAAMYADDAPRNTPAPESRASR